MYVNANMIIHQRIILIPLDCSIFLKEFKNEMKMKIGIGIRV